MKAAVYDINGPPSVLHYADVPDPVVGPGDVLIAVEAVSIEGGDILNRQAVPPPGAAYIVGYQAGGTIAARGADVTRLAVGQKVAGFNWRGSHAASFAVPEHFAYPVPAGLDIEVASTVPVTFGTAGKFVTGRRSEGN